MVGDAMSGGVGMRGGRFIRLQERLGIVGQVDTVALRLMCILRLERGPGLLAMGAVLPFWQGWRGVR